MLRTFIRASVVAVLGAIAMLFAFGAASATPQDKKDEKVPSINEIMTKGHDGPNSLIAKIKTAAKAEKWDDAKASAKTLAVYGESLGKNKQPKGDDASWKALCDKYAASTKIILKATEERDIKAVSKGLGGVNCGDCHKIHKP